MSWNTAAKPTGWVNVTTVRHGNLFLDSDSLTFALSATTAVSYEVRNYYGAVVASGLSSGTSLHLAAMPLGWYKLYLYRTASDATYGTLIGTCMFSIVRTDARLAAPPTPSGQGGGSLAFEGQDHITNGVALIGVFRNQIQHAEDPTNNAYGSNIARTQEDRAYQRTWYEANPDAVRPRHAFLQFPNGGYQDAGHTTGVSSVVSTLYPDIDYFEGPTNEPNVGDAALITAMQTFKTAVKAGNASAKVMGPSVISVNGNQLTGWESFFAGGGMAGVDALSFHFYNCANGDVALGRRTMDAFTALLAKYGLSGIEKWQTEWGQFAATYGVYNTRRQAQWAMMHRFLLDQYGVPKERDYWFYSGSHGFWDFPSFWKAQPFDGTWRSEVMPMVAMYRVFSQEIFGKQWTGRLDFGTVANDFYIGSRYTDPGDGSSVLTFLSDGRTDGTARLLVTGADGLQVVGPFGTIQTITSDSHGIVTVPVAQEPVYARVPAGVTVTVEQVSYGPDLARTASGSGGGTTPSTPLNGVLENGYYSGSAATEYRDPTTLPASFTATWVEAQEGDTVMVNCPKPWQQQATFLDFDVSYQDASDEWHLLETFTEDPATIQSATPEDQGGCFYETYHSGRSVFVIEMPRRITAKAIRLDVRDTTAGGEATDASNAAGGQGWGPKKITLRELSFYCRQPKPHRRVFAARVSI